MARDDARNVRHDPRYADLPPEVVPDTECLADVVERMLPYWYDAIVPDLQPGRTVLVAAHGNSLRALVKHLERHLRRRHRRAQHPDRRAAGLRAGRRLPAGRRPTGRSSATCAPPTRSPPPPRRSPGRRRAERSGFPGPNEAGPTGGPGGGAVLPGRPGVPADGGTVRCRSGMGRRRTARVGWPGYPRTPQRALESRPPTVTVGPIPSRLRSLRTCLRLRPDETAVTLAFASVRVARCLASPAFLRQQAYPSVTTMRDNHLRSQRPSRARTDTVGA